MKKILFSLLTLFVMGISQLSAQMPSCNNDNMVSNQISARENQGYTVLSAEWYQVAYLVAPEPPYLTGTYEVTMVGPYCGPACTPAIEVLRWDATVTNDNGKCHWSRVN